jgi:ubiquinone/menaquinone biosynthesis C-methylase UbiE
MHQIGACVRAPPDRLLPWRIAYPDRRGGVFSLSLKNCAAVGTQARRDSLVRIAMDPQTLQLLCDPETHVPLELAGGSLRNPDSEQCYPIRDGIPVFLREVSGLNRKYQSMYDRLAPGYDFAERLYYWISRKPSHRLEYIRELEIAAGAQVIEVSVGTGANLSFLRKEIEFFGLDLSWGMLRKCRRKLKRWQRDAQLFQGEAERLPFRDAVFDCVFHVGGINFFNDKARAITEMVRVARSGTKIVIVDETEKYVREGYQKNPLTRSYYEGQEKAAFCPIGLVPAEMGEIQARQIAEGKMYCLTFRKP